MARKSDLRDVNCSVAQALSVVGDAWTLMILRCAFNGVRTYQAFRGQLDLSSSVLSEKLSALVAEGVFERRASAADKRSVEYRLTQKGFDLYPALIALMQWGEKWAPDPAQCGPRMRLIERASGEEIIGARVLSAAGAPLQAWDVRVERHGGATEAAEDRAALEGAEKQA
ncbi:MAG: helix-turn-helix domain-containing protein [Pseudomonadota bacterium]